MSDQHALLLDDFMYTEEAATLEQIHVLNALLALPAVESFRLEFPEMPHDVSEFDRFFEEHGYQNGQEPEAFAAWLANATGHRISGLALDGSGAVQADPEQSECS
jgi:hypothetical protein